MAFARVFYQRAAADQGLMISIRRRSRRKCNFPNFIQTQRNEPFRSPKSMFAWLIEVSVLKSEVAGLSQLRPPRLLEAAQPRNKSLDPVSYRRRSRRKCDFPNFIQSGRDSALQDLDLDATKPDPATFGFC